MTYDRWRETIVRWEGRMGGEPCFPGTRLPVRMIGRMVNDGTKIDTILWMYDYPQITAQVVRYAARWVRERRRGRLVHEDPYPRPSR